MYITIVNELKNSVANYCVHFLNTFFNAYSRLTDGFFLCLK